MTPKHYHLTSYMSNEDFESVKELYEVMSSPTFEGIEIEIRPDELSKYEKLIKNIILNAVFSVPNSKRIQ